MSKINFKGNTGWYSPQACQTCKARKRRCNKTLPTCSSCAMRDVRCEYAALQDSPSSAESTTPSTATAASIDVPWLDETTQHCIQQIDYPTLLFLDPTFLNNGHLNLSHHSSIVPNRVLDLLGDKEERSLTASKYFEYVHPWMPFVPRKRLYDIYLEAPLQCHPEIAILLLAMKLITTLPASGPQSPQTVLYSVTKHYHLDVERSGNLSIPVLQSGVLIVLYELGHGIYPAAFMTIGACARYAHLLGIGVGKGVKATKVLTLVESEERRRIWWATVILDRFVNVGCPGRPLVIADPQLDDLLPCDDTAWDAGIIPPAGSAKLSSPTTAHMSKFALLCQASLLLGQAIRYNASEPPEEDDGWEQLDRTLESMLNAALTIENPDHDQITFVYSALVSLHAPYISNFNDKSSPSERSKRANAVIQKIGQRIQANLVERQCFMGRDPESVSPWSLYFAYRVCGAHMRYVQKSEESSKLVNFMKEAFGLIGKRWRVARTYLQLLEAQEVMHDNA